MGLQCVLSQACSCLLLAFWSSFFMGFLFGSAPGVPCTRRGLEATKQKRQTPHAATLGLTPSKSSLLKTYRVYNVPP